MVYGKRNQNLHRRLPSLDPPELYTPTPLPATLPPTGIMVLQRVNAAAAATAAVTCI